MTFHPASVNLSGARFGLGVPQHQSAGSSIANGKQKEKEKERVLSTLVKETFLKAFSNSTSGSGSSNRGKEKERQLSSSSAPGPPSSTTTPVVIAQTAGNGNGTPSSTRQTHVFSLVERSTFKPSSADSGDGISSPRLLPEIQYWAGVIMQNACRKDDSRGGIRQCANSPYPSCPIAIN